MDTIQRRAITRNREILACTECRRRKLKCDRHTPCNSCLRRDDESSCTYQRSSNGLDRERERRIQAEARLEHLEKLVEQVAEQGNGSAFQGRTNPNQQVDQETSSIEAEASLSDGVVYNGSSHWSAMLEDIEGLKSAILTNTATVAGDDIFEPEANIEVNFILGAAVPLSLQQVLAQCLPARHEADRLTAAYFRSKSVSAPFIHAVQFRRLHDDFWKDPLSAPVLWTSILFSVFYIAKNTLSLSKETVSSENRYSFASAQCLALGNYFRPRPLAVESLLLFVQAKCLTGLDMSPDIGVIFGLLIRLATSMGYHRDPDILHFSTFEREMRRRTWSLCMQLDLLISFQLGLPSNIQFPTWDTRPPRNLQDFDFDEDTKELPPARPDSEPTDMLFYIAKHRLMAVFEKILRHNLTQGMDGSTNVDKLDIEIRNVYSALPDILRPRPMADSVVDSSSLIVTRLCVYFIYQKSLCVLHRPYVARGWLHSTRICYEAASNIVQYFIDTYKEFLPGGQIETERWFMSSITWHDYLLGVMVLCLVLCANSQGIAGPGFNSAETLELLQRARDVCVGQSIRSKDSARVQRIVDATLLHFDSLEFRNNKDSTINSSPPTSAIGLSEMESPFTVYQADAQGFEMPHNPQDFPLDQTDACATCSDTLARAMEDPSWTYLEQFLNLPDDDDIQPSL